MAVFGVLLCKLWGLIISPNPLPFTTDAENKREAVTLFLPALASAYLHSLFTQIVNLLEPLFNVYLSNVSLLNK